MSKGLTRFTILSSIVSLLVLLNSAKVVYAHCPLCVAGAAVGVASARYYGVDDIITGIWLGAFVISMALWSGKLIKQYVKKNYIPFQHATILSAIVIATIAPFYFAGFFKGMPNMSDSIFGINRLAFGTLIGAISIIISPYLSREIKRRGVIFSYQTLSITFCTLLVLSLIFWYVTRYYYVI